MAWRVPSLGRYWEEHKGADNRAAFRALVRSGGAFGCIALEDATPVGWCGFGPRKDFDYLNRARKLPKGERMTPQLAGKLMSGNLELPRDNPPKDKKGARYMADPTRLDLLAKRFGEESERVALGPPEVTSPSSPSSPPPIVTSENGVLYSASGDSDIGDDGDVTQAPTQQHNSIVTDPDPQELEEAPF